MPLPDKRPDYSPWPHRVAVLLTCATFPLIWVGGLVTSYDAGMAVPDWPSTYGYNLFLYPLDTWFWGPWDLFIEHGHRLLGAGVGLLAIVFVVVAFVFDNRRWLRRLAVAALLLVIVQGLLGGARVVLNERSLAMIHGCVGPAFFSFCAVLAVFTSRRWRQPVELPLPGGQRLARVAVLTCGLTLLQLLIGAQLRHAPVTMPHRAFTAVVLFHLVLAGVLAVHVVWLAAIACRHRRRGAGLVVPGLGLVVVLGIQVCLGAATWITKYGWPHWFVDTPLAAVYTVQAQSMLQALVATGHAATGSLLLATTAVLAARSLRQAPAKATVTGLTMTLMGIPA